MLDMIAICAPVGQAIGRIGCFLNGCCYGSETQGWWGVKFSCLENPVHPTELYLSAGDLLVFFILYLFYREKHQEGEITGWYLIFFGSLRYGIDFLRGDLIPNSIGLYPTQIFAAAVFLIGAFWIFSITFRKKPSGKP